MLKGNFVFARIYFSAVYLNLRALKSDVRIIVFFLLLQYDHLELRTGRLIDRWLPEMKSTNILSSEVPISRIFEYANLQNLILLSREAYLTILQLFR